MNYNIELAIGSNLGDRHANIEAAINFLKSMVGEISHQTKIIETEPQGFDSENFFLNMIIKITTNNSPSEVLKKIKLIEKKMGRNLKERKSELYQDRIIDIDILRFENLYFNSKKLKIPHEKINERFFFNFNLIGNQ